jgi:DNA primase
MMEYHRMSFPEALKELARRAGIVLPEYSPNKKDKTQPDKSELVHKSLALAAEFFFKALNSTNGKAAMSYFIKRGFSEDLIKRFQLGYSPDTWDSLLNELKKQGYSESTILDAGLIIEREGGKGYYDRFRGRAMFPVLDSIGRVIAFGARRMNEDDTQPKYINSPQTIAYDKSRSLYGLYQAKDELRTKGYTILVEGYADVLSMHQAGYRNAVASSGTALTKEQLDTIARYNKKLYICYDADNAGIKAATRAVEIAAPYGFDIRVIRLPVGEDPDSIIQKHGNSLFQSYIDGAANFIDFIIELKKKEGLLDSPSSKTDVLRQVLGIISSIPDRLQHDFYINRLSVLLSLSESHIQKLYDEKKILEKKAKKPADHDIQSGRGEQVNQKHIEESGSSINESKSETQIFDIDIESLLPEEYYLIFFAVMSHDAYMIMTGDLKFSIDNFISNAAKLIFRSIVDVYKLGPDLMSNIVSTDEIDGKIKDFLMQVAFGEYHHNKNWEKFRPRVPELNSRKSISDAISGLEIRAIETKIGDITANLQKLPFEEQKPLLQQYNDLIYRKKSILDSLAGKEI